VPFCYQFYAKWLFIKPLNGAKCCHHAEKYKKSVKIALRAEKKSETVYFFQIKPLYLSENSSQQDQFLIL
jgi:hypothetical protein